MLAAVVLLLLTQVTGIDAKVESLKVAPSSQTVISALIDVHDDAAEFHPEQCDVEVLSGPSWLEVASEEAVFEPAAPGIVRVLVPATVNANASGKAELRLRVKIYYCNNFEGWCRADKVDVKVPVEVVAPSAAKIVARPPIWTLIIAAAFLVATFAFFFLPRYVRSLCCVGFVVFGLIGAVQHREHIKAYGIAKQLCVSCIGLERTYVLRGSPRIAAETRDFVASLNNTYEIVVFSAEWCTNCPYAKAVVKKMVEASGGKLTMRIVDVEKDKDEAAKYPIERGGRIALPAVAVRTKDGVEVIFGAQNIEKRLVDLLRRLEGRQR
ncbi:MAG: hypothetical protein DRP82_05785 [Planctomycetota bacterium]|nr:MAG: hypothetical protein DRP82_05785 [Planctomycetota bacterium]